jgi:hypothetical protein
VIGESRCTKGNDRFVNRANACTAKGWGSQTAAAKPKWLMAVFRPDPFCSVQDPIVT